MKKRYINIPAFSQDQIPILNNELRDIWDIINKLPVVSSVPTGGNNGDIKLYESGATRRLYAKISGTWRFINFDG